MQWKPQSSATAIATITMVAAITIASIWAFVEDTIGHTLTVQNEWIHFEHQTTERIVILDDLRDSIGYGGLIHNFKNYVLRGTSQYHDRAKTNISEVALDISQFRTLNLSQPELAAISAIETTVADYTSMLEIVKTEVAKQTPASKIDIMVKINDEPALLGLSTLTQLAVDRGSLHRQSTGLAINDSLTHIRRGYLLIPLVFVTSVIFIIILNRLRTAKVKAERSAQAKTDFLANMSHELRTPLNAIIGFSDAMLSGISGPINNKMYSEYTEHIRDSGSHLLHLINEILDLSKVEAGKLKLIEGEVILQDIILSSLSTISPRAQSAGVRINNLASQTPIVLWADDLRLKQILLNLLSNAVKFTRPDSNVTVDVRMREDGGCDISVADQGMGMSDEGIRIALDPFGQVDSSHTRHREGTGLGLPLTKGLIKLHGGTLEIKSLEGHGTMVTATFPKERVL